MPTKNKATTSQTNTLNPWSQQQYQQLSSQIEGIANRPFQAYTGPLTAGLNPEQQQAQALAQSNVGAGQGAVNAGINAAQGMLSFASQPVSAPTAQSAQLAPAQTWTAQGYAPSSAVAAQAGSPALAQASGYQASQTQGVSAAPAAQARARGYQATDQAKTQLGPTSETTATAVDRGKVGNVGQGMIDTARIQQLLNPATDDVIDAGVTDLDNARKRTIAGAQGDFTKAGAFGGTREGVADSLTNDDYLRNVANLSANLRQQAYNSATGLAEGEAQRGQAAQQANQGADLSVQNTNANLKSTSDLANAQARNAANLAQGQLNEQTAANDASARNAAAQFGAGAANAAALANSQARTQNNQFNAGLAAQIGQANTGALNAAAQFGASAANNVSSQNATAQNQGSQFDAAQRQATALANAQAADSAAQFGAAAANSAAASNAQARNSSTLAQGQFDQQTALANADAALRASQGNQSADLSAAGLRNSATGMLGNLGQTQQSLGLNDVNSLAAMGLLGQQTDQAGLTAAYQEFLRQQQYPQQQAGMLSALLGMTPMLQNSQGTTTQTQGVNPMQAIASALQVAAMLG